MVNAVHALFTRCESAVLADTSRLTRTSLVNRGRDTKLTFQDGSIIVLKGVKQIGAVLTTPSKMPPIGPDISCHR